MADDERQKMDRVDEASFPGTVIQGTTVEARLRSERDALLSWAAGNAGCICVYRGAAALGMTDVWWARDNDGRWVEGDSAEEAIRNAVGLEP